MMLRPFDELVDLADLCGYGHPIWESASEERDEWIVRVGPHLGVSLTRAGAEMRVIRVLRDLVIREMQVAA